MDDPDPRARAEALSYKLRKEAFVSNLSGSSLTDINLVTLVAASAILLWSVLMKRGLFAGADSSIVYAVDFLLNVCAVLFAFTVYSSVPIFLNLALIAPACLLLLPLQTRAKNTKKSKAKPDRTKAASFKISNGVSKPGEGLKPGTLIVRPFLTTYRGAMLIATAISILAVDFRVFPRRFAKVETWGTSLMDLGVGSFVFSAGVVGARSVIREAQDAPNTKSRSNVTGRLVKSLRHALPLFILGIARLVSVKNLDYAEHVTEYGVHWNFFFTLALLPPFVEAVDYGLAMLTSPTGQSRPKSNSVRNDAVAMLISIIYEVVLNTTRLLPFILIAPRTPESDLITKNREGIFSFLGYLAIFLAGRSTGVLVCQFQSASAGSPAKGVSAVEAECQAIDTERTKVILPRLFIRAAVYTVLYLLATSVYTFSLTVSRRLANLPYVLWILAFNNAQLLLFALIEAFGPPYTFSRLAHDESAEEGDVAPASKIASPITRAFNGNGLALFLVANLGTGLVNLTMRTLDTQDAQAMGVLVIYAAVLSALAVGLDRSGVRLKI